MLYFRWHHRKTCHDPIDYELGDKVDFWVTEEETSPELDIDEIENLIYDESAIPIGESSENNEGKYLVILNVFHLLKTMKVNIL